ncbi:MAG: type II secretion system GspH family protein [Candidatus Omnitrophica bacterium]|nr:type II secretion system GspH family protein [Candidatus Omnitrophota bacterium]
MNNRKGLSLIEIIVSVLIITIMAAGVFGAFVGTEYIFNRARHRLQAFNFAREVQDRLRGNYGYTDSQMNIATGHLESEVGSIIRGEMANLSTELTYDVSEPEVNGYKKVEVKVSWTETSF